MTGLGGLLLLAWFDFGMLAALLVCCVVAGQGLERRGCSGSGWPRPSWRNASGPVCVPISGF